MFHCTAFLSSSKLSGVLIKIKRNNNNNKKIQYSESKPHQAMGAMLQQHVFKTSAEFDLQTCAIFRLLYIKHCTLYFSPTPMAD